MWLAWTGSCNCSSNTCVCQGVERWHSLGQDWVPPTLRRHSADLLPPLGSAETVKCLKESSSEGWNGDVRGGNAVSCRELPEHCLFSHGHSRSWQLFPCLESWNSVQFSRLQTQRANSHQHWSGTMKNGFLIHTSIKMIVTDCEEKRAVYTPFWIQQPSEEVRTVENIKMKNKKEGQSQHNNLQLSSVHTGMFLWLPQTADLLEIYIWILGKHGSVPFPRGCRSGLSRNVTVTESLRAWVQLHLL